MFFKEDDLVETSIGRVPTDWKVERLGNTVAYNKGKKPDSSGEFKQGLLPYLTVESLRTGRFEQWAAGNGNTVIVEPKDIIMIWDGFHSGEVFTGFRGILSSTAVRIRPRRSDIENRFLFNVLKTRFKELNTKTAGMYLKHVNKSVFESLIVPVPPLPESRQISLILSKIENAIQKTDEIIAKTEHLQMGLLQELLTNGIGHEEFKDSEIGMIPKEWKIVKLGEVVSSNIQNGLYKHSSFYGEGVPIIRIENFDSNKIDLGVDFKRVSLTEDELATYSLEPGDIVLNRVNSIDFVGKSILIPGIREPMVFESNMMRFRVEQKLLSSQFAVTYLNSQRATRYLRSRAKRAVHQASVNQQDVSSTPIPLPTLTEQREIVRLTSNLDAGLNAEGAEKARLERMKQGFMNELLSGRIRVKVAG